MVENGIFNYDNKISTKEVLGAISAMSEFGGKWDDLVSPLADALNTKDKKDPQFLVKVTTWEKYDDHGYRGPYKIDHLNSKDEVLKKYPDAKQISEKFFTVQRGIKSARQN